jgi:hypothetical protein
MEPAGAKLWKFPSFDLQIRQADTETQTCHTQPALVGSLANEEGEFPLSPEHLNR